MSVLAELRQSRTEARKEYQAMLIRLVAGEDVPDDERRQLMIEAEITAEQFDEHVRKVEARRQSSAGLKMREEFTNDSSSFGRQIAEMKADVEEKIKSIQERAKAEIEAEELRLNELREERLRLVREEGAIRRLTSGAYRHLLDSADPAIDEQLKPLRAELRDREGLLTGAQAKIVTEFGEGYADESKALEKCLSDNPATRTAEEQMRLRQMKLKRLQSLKTEIQQCGEAVAETQQQIGQLEQSKLDWRRIDVFAE